jgi:ribosomal protein L13E
MWIRRDWDDFFNRIRKRGAVSHPPRPVDRSARNRLVPADGYSLAELDDVGLSLEQAELLGLPIDAGRVGRDQANITALQMYLRASRSRY